MTYSCIPPFDFQANLLNYLAQEALAHAALIFATLGAAFTFAAGFRKTVSKQGKVPLYVYGGILSLLFLVAVYALFRFTLYAGLTEFLLTKSRPPSCDDNFTSYWINAVRDPAENNQTLLLPISGLYSVGLVGLVIACFVAYLLAFFTTLLASGLLSVTPRRSLIRVGILVIFYIIYLIVFSIVVAIPSNPLEINILWLPIIFLGSAIINVDRGMYHDDGYPHPKHWRGIPSRKSIRNICKSRAIRLYALLILGSVAGFAIAYYCFKTNLGDIRNSPWCLGWLMSPLTFLSFVYGLPIVYEIYREYRFIESRIKIHLQSSKNG